MRCHLCWDRDHCRVLLGTTGGGNCCQGRPDTGMMAMACIGCPMARDVWSWCWSQLSIMEGMQGQHLEVWGAGPAAVRGGMFYHPLCL